VEEIPVYRSYLTALADLFYPEGRIGYREGARRNGTLGDIPSIDYRYDHDVDEFMA
jgi:hypothetical protein